jgi:hypothetical protein
MSPKIYYRPPTESSPFLLDRLVYIGLNSSLTAARRKPRSLFGWGGPTLSPSIPCRRVSHPQKQNIPNDKQVHGLDSCLNRGCSTSAFFEGACHRTGEKRPYALESAYWLPASILESGCLFATPDLTGRAQVRYSSLRRKKSHSLSGDSDLHARSESEQLRQAKPSCLAGISPSTESKHDPVTCLESTATTTRQVKSLFGEGSWACA